MVEMEENEELVYVALAEFQMIHRFVHNEQSKLEVKCCQIRLKLQMVCLISIFELYIRKFLICGFFCL